MQKIDLSEIARKLSNAATMCKDANEDLNTASWQYENGVLISANEAKAIATALEELPKMHEALMALSTDMMDYLQNFDSPKVGLWAKKCNEILQQFETPELPEPQSNLVCKNDQIDRDYGF